MAINWKISTVVKSIMGKRMPRGAKEIDKNRGGIINCCEMEKSQGRN